MPAKPPVVVKLPRVQAARSSDVDVASISTLVLLPAVCLAALRALYLRQRARSQASYAKVAMGAAEEDGAFTIDELEEGEEEEVVRL